jgi:RecJ-like exonuclease
MELETKVDMEPDVIREAEEKKEECYTALGKSFYEKHREVADEEEQKLFAEIDRQNERIDEEIRAREVEQALANEGLMRCPACQEKISVDARFCQYCGTRVAQQEEVICKNCGKPVKPGYLFCTHCGTKV